MYVHTIHVLFKGMTIGNTFLLTILFTKSDVDVCDDESIKKETTRNKRYLWSWRFEIFIVLPL